MARRRKTKAEREQDWAEVDRRVWNQFRSRLEALTSFAEAQLLVDEAPPPDSPGRRYYSNLGFFLQAFTVPMESSYAEKALYLQFIQRLDAEGALKPGAGQRVQDELRRAMEAQGS
jgi:hypothetical protein